MGIIFNTCQGTSTWRAQLVLALAAALDVDEAVSDTDDDDTMLRMLLLERSRVMAMSQISQMLLLVNSRTPLPKRPRNELKCRHL